MCLTSFSSTCRLRWQCAQCWEYCDTARRCLLIPYRTGLRYAGRRGTTPLVAWKPKRSCWRKMLRGARSGASRRQHSMLHPGMLLFKYRPPPPSPTRIKFLPNLSPPCSRFLPFRCPLEAIHSRKYLSPSIQFALRPQFPFHSSSFPLRFINLPSVR